MKEHLIVGEASLELGICVKTLHRWEKSKKLLSSFRTFGNHRRYLKYDVLKIKNKERRINIGYSRVSSYDQKKKGHSFSSMKPWHSNILVHHDLGSVRESS